MSKTKKEEGKEVVVETEINLEVFKAEPMTAKEFAMIRNLGAYYEEQFRIIYGEELKTAEEWKQFLIKEKIINPNIL